MKSPVRILQLKNIAKTFDSQLIFKNLNVDVHENEIIALLGPSGCGKSTLLRMIAGLESVNTGRVEFSSSMEADVGYVFQKPILYPHLDVAGNVALGIADKISKTERKERIANELCLVGLEGFSSRKIESLSGGEAQRVTVVRALLNQPALLLLDEPFSALDIPTRRKIAHDTRAVLKSKKTSAIHVTHDPQEAEIIADRVLNWDEITSHRMEEE
ncbi:MAG: ABC-type nitrate/sulfonate/bicarbonate transport system ATPase subunit [Candidatus Poseidoniaceae archaeon]|jgi:ABC-type nitrate/sulfonate/bicarbonate transport system ATPase subunit